MNWTYFARTSPPAHQYCPDVHDDRPDILRLPSVLTSMPINRAYFVLLCPDVHADQPSVLRPKCLLVYTWTLAINET